MPIHEFRCNACMRKSSHYFSSFATAERALARIAEHDPDTTGLPVCTRCGSHDLQRLFGRFAVRRGSSGDGPDEAAIDGALAGLDQDDPRAMARWARQMARDSDMDGELGPDFDEALGRIEQGENPEEVMNEYEPDESMPGGDD